MSSQKVKLKLSEKLNLNLVRLSEIFKTNRSLYFKTDAERNLYDIIKMLSEVNIKNFFRKY